VAGLRSRVSKFSCLMPCQRTQNLRRLAKWFVPAAKAGAMSTA